MQPQENHPIEPVAPEPQPQPQPQPVTPIQPTAPAPLPAPIVPPAAPMPPAPTPTTQSPEPITPVTPPPTQPAPVPAQGQTHAPITPLTQADFAAMAKKNRKPKRIILAVLIIAILAGAAYLVYASGLLGGMKTVEYNNGQGQTYSLKFYAQNKTDSLKTSAAGSGSEGSKALIAKKGKDGKAPLSVYIDSLSSGYSDSSETTSKAYDNNSKCLGETPVGKTYNEWAGSDVYICDAVNDDEIELIYYSTFKKGNELLYVLVMQDIDYESMDSSEKAKDILKTVGLEVYDEEIKQIIGSIKPL